MIPKKYIFLIIVAWCALVYIMSGCFGVKKLELRLNAKEYASAADYIFEGDNVTYTYFVSEILQRNPHLLLKAEDKEKIKTPQGKAYRVKWRLVNAGNNVRAFFQKLGYKIEDNCFIDTMYIRESRTGTKLSFKWGVRNNDDNCLRVAKFIGRKNKKDKYIPTVLTYPDTIVKTVSVKTKSRKGRHRRSHYTTQTRTKIVEKDIRQLLINEYLVVENPDTLLGYKPKTLNVLVASPKGEIVIAHVPNEGFEFLDVHYKSVDLFDMSTVFMVLPFFIIITLLLGSFETIIALFQGGQFGCFFFLVLFIVLVLGFVYVGYEIVEKMLFEVFLINLPH